MTLRLNENDLKQIIGKTVKSVIKEIYGRRRPAQKGYMWVNGRDFLEKALELEGVELARTVKTDETLMEIFNGEFKIVCEASYYPATRYSPEENNFEILDDSGLMELIENVADENIKSTLYSVYEDDVEGGDFDFYDPYDGYADYVHDRRMDDRGTGDIRENTDESLRPRKNHVFSTDDTNSISRIRGLKQDYDPFLYGEDEELAKNKETLSNLISDRANGKKNMLPRNKARFVTTDMYADESEKEYKDRLYDNDMYYRNPEGTENMFDDEPGYNEPYEVNESRFGAGETPFVKLANIVSKNNDIDWKGIYHEVFGENTWARDVFRNALNKYIVDGIGYPYECDEYAKKTLDIINDNTVINESKLKDLVMKTAKKVLKEMDELSPKLLQKAADKAWDMNRWSQHDAFEDEARARAQAEFGENNGIRIVTPKKISYEAPDGGFCAIFRDGTYSYRPRNGYNNETGNLHGGNGFPKYMRVPDKRTARSLVKWWQKYNNADTEIPFMNDWHELVEW